MRLHLAGLAALGALAASARVAAADPAAQLSAACASCHAPDGKAAGIPSLTGLGQSGIAQAMLAYRSGARMSQIMHVVAAALSPQEIAAVAHYLASRPAP